MYQYNTTASTLLAMLCYVESGKTAPIAYDDDAMAAPLAAKLKEAVGERGGSQSATIYFSDEEDALFRQFQGCAKNVMEIFSQLSEGFKG
jgi:hypothetical protein